MIVVCKKKRLPMIIIIVVMMGMLSGLLSVTNNFRWGIMLIFILLIASTMKKSKLPYIPSILLTSLSFIIIPWTKNEFRLGPIQIVYLPFIIYGIILFISNLKKKSLLPNFLYIDSGSKLINNILCYFLIYGTMSVFWVNDYKSWAIYLIYWYFNICIIFSFTTSIYKDKEKLIRFIIIHLFLLSISSMLGLFRFFVLGYPDANPILIFNRNGSLFMYIPFYAVLLSLYYMFKKKIFYWYMVVTFTMSFILIFSRTGYLAATLSIVLYYGLIVKTKQGVARIFKSVFIICFLCVIFLPVFTIFDFDLKQAIITRILLIQNGLAFISGKGENIVYDLRRVQLIDGGIHIIKNNWLLGTGIGLGNYLYYFPTNITSVPARAHNLYISYLGELGILGFWSLIAFFLSTFIYFLGIVRKVLDIKYKSLGYGFIIGHVVMVLAFATNEYITFPYVWFFWGLAFSYFKLMKNNYIAK